MRPDDARVDDDETLSADLFIERAGARGRWLFYLEGSSSVDGRGASGVLAESNADAGTAVDRNGNARIQVSEINYRIERSDRGRLTVGLIDPSGYLDRTRITNDENVQFLGVSFVNNPTIEVPDYSLGLAYERPGRDGRPQLNVVATSSNGLADNPSRSYSDLVQVGAEDKGVFVALGVGWATARNLARLGVWVNTRSRPSLDGRDAGADNHGVYAVYGRSWGAHAINLRAGTASSSVARGDAFAALAYRAEWRGHAFGIALARTRLSGDARAGDLDDSVHAEAYARFTIDRRFHLTASVQRIEHSSFVASAGDPRDSARLAGLRFHFEF